MVVGILAFPTRRSTLANCDLPNSVTSEGRALQTLKWTVHYWGLVVIVPTQDAAVLAMTQVDVVQRFTLNLFGAFRLLAPDGQRVDISSKKGVALIATLAMANDGERTRSWLHEKLWGTREPTHGRNSLRRELANLRRSLNICATPLLICEHDRVRLDLQRVKVDAREPGAANNLFEGEFLEGLDVAGEDGFEEWLREQRRNLERSRRRAGRAGAGDDDGTANLASLPSRIVDVTQPAPGFGGKPALAVLPFMNLTGEPANDYIAEGLSEELIDRLSRLRWLPVIARSSSFSFTGRDADSERIGRELGAKYLLQGRLRIVGEEFGLAVNLSEASTGHVLWSYRRTLPTRFSQDTVQELVADLVAVLDVSIDHAEQARAHAKPGNERDVSELTWRGRWHMNRFTRADAEIARNLFAEALELDPTSPETLIQATFNLGWSIWAERRSEDQVREMRRLAHRAISADCDDGRAHMLAGIAEMWLRHPAQAKALLQQAIALNPSLALAHAQLGGCHNLANEPTAAVAALKTALRLSPNDTHLFYFLGELGLSYSMLSRWDDAIEHANQAIIRRPAYWYAHMIKVNAYVRSGDRKAAAAAYADLMEACPKFLSSHLDWLPFVDRAWNAHFREGLAMAEREGSG